MGRIVLALTLAVALAATAVACGGGATEDTTGATPRGPKRDRTGHRFRRR